MGKGDLPKWCEAVALAEPGRGGGRPTAEQIQEMMKNATPEQRAAWEKRAAERRNRGGDRRSDGESEEKSGEVSPDGT